MSSWKTTRLTALYLKCLKNKHDVKVWKSGFNLIYLKCETCGVVWRVHYHKLDYITPEDVSKVFK